MSQVASPGTARSAGQVCKPLCKPRCDSGRFGAVEVLCKPAYEPLCPPFSAPRPSTHKIDGLVESDFVLAAKFDDV